MPLLGWALLTPALVQAVVDFDPARRDFVCGRLARDVAPIDFNSDGHLDLACVRFTVPGVVTLLEGDGRGNFRFFGELPAGDGATAILSADINEDGHPDLVTTGFVDSPNGTIGLHVGDGQGNFTYEALQFAPGIAPFQVNAADLDGDHHIDLVAGGTGTGDGVVRIFNGNGQGQFAPGDSLYGAQAPQQTAIGDIDGDRDPDLAVADNMGDVLLFRNDGAGGFAPGQPLEVGREPVWIDIRTFEDRARPYLAVALRTEQTVEVFQWNPTADAPERVAALDAPFSPICVTFLEPTLFHDPARPGGQGVSRRRPGLAVVSQTSSQVRIWRSLDQQPLVLAAQDSPTAIRLGDWNQDKLPDFAIPGFNTESVSLFVGGKALAESAPFVPVDSLPIQILPVTMDANSVPDFAILRRTARVLTALVGRKDGTFESRPIGEAFPDVPTGMAAFNLEDDTGDDLQPDFAVGRAVGTELWILGSGKQYQRDTIFMAGSGPTSMKAADLDLDGHDDLIASLFLSDNLSVHFGRGGNSGFEVGVPVQVGDGPYAIDAADLNNNGLLDLVVANHDGMSFTTVLQPQPRMLTPYLTVPTAVGFPRGIAIGQLTDDFVPDVALGGELGLEVFAGDGTGGFTSALFVPTAAEFETVRITDLDGDGGAELVAADRLGAAIVVLTGQVPQAGASATPGPGGGQVLLDLPQLSFGVEFGPSDFALTELNGDGAPDLAVISPLAGRMTMLFGRHSIPGRRLRIVAQGAPELGAEVRLGPNPFSDQTTFRITGSDRRRVWLRIFDPQGRCVASPFTGAIGPEAIDVRWNGLDDRGQAVPGGIYFYRLESTGVQPMAGKLVRLAK